MKLQLRRQKNELSNDKTNNMESVIRVVPRDDFTLELWFNTGDHRVFDMTPYLDHGVFTKLKDLTHFKRAYIAFDTVCWPDNLDIAPETLFDRSVPVTCDEAPASSPATTLKAGG